MNSEQKPSEEKIILNSKPAHLYSHEFDDNRFFQIVFQDEKETHIKLAPRTLMKGVYLKQKDDIEGFEVEK